MTKEDYENDAILLSKTAEKVAGWNPDALAYMAEEIERTEKAVRLMRKKLNTARKVA